jgi:hypothetical protein
MGDQEPWYRKVGKAVRPLILDAGAISCILYWAGIKPGDFHMISTVPHAIGLVTGLGLSGASIYLSVRTRFSRKQDLENLTNGYKDQIRRLEASHASDLYREKQIRDQVESEKRDLEARLQLKAPSKLSIVSADYGTGDGREDVTECLKQMVSGDSLVLKVENHSFVVGGRNYVPEDPKRGAVKYLRITYSYGSGNSVTIERPEGSLTVLPEDTYLKDVASLFNPLQSEALRLARDLEVFLSGMGEWPHKGERFKGGGAEEYQLFCDTLYADRVPWIQRLKHGYALELEGRVGDMIHRLGAARVDVHDLEECTKYGVGDEGINIKRTAAILRQLAVGVEQL